MLGLIVLIVMGGYLVLSIFLVIATYRSMKKKGRTGRKAWLPAVLVGLVMYLLVFWDHVPTMVAHNYYCDKYAGFTVYKTVEQWKIENNNIKLVKLDRDQRIKPTKSGNIEIYKLNSNFRLHINQQTKLLNIRMTTKKLISKIDNTTLAQFIDYDTDIIPFTVRARSIRDYKMWLTKKSCEPDGRYVNRRLFSSMAASTVTMGE